MRNYVARAVLTLAAGIRVVLTKEQAAVRAHALMPLSVDKKTGAGTYETTEAIQFKAGEKFSTDADLNKQLADTVETVETAAARAKAEAASIAAAGDLEAIRDKAGKWDEVQEELLALRAFVNDVSALPKALLDQVKAELDKATAAAKAKG